MPVQVRPATGRNLIELAEVAAATFPLACPPSAATADIDDFIAATLSPQRFAEYLADPDRVILTAVDIDRIIGYTMLVHGTGTDPDVASCIDVQPAVELSKMPAVELSKMPAVELSKMYVLPHCHGGGAAAALMQTGIDWAVRRGARAVWLGVNQGNHRAQRFYRKHGFGTVGVRTFRLGTAVEDDFVMVRPCRDASPV